MKYLAAVLAVLAVLAPMNLGAQIQIKPGEYKVYGHGAASCGTWIQRQREGGVSSNSTKAWIVGFVSGAGYVAAPSLGVTDSDGVAAFVDKYCAENPLKTIANATEELVDTLQRK